MERYTAWFRNCGSPESAEADVKRDLEAAGIQLTAYGKENPPGPFGIVGFHQVTDELFAILHNARRDGRSRVLVLTAPATGGAPPVWRLLHAGALEVLVWSPGGVTGKQVRAKLERWSMIDSLVDAASARESLIGASAAWRALVRNAVEAAHFTRAPVLMTGESGTGKEMLARLISAVLDAEEGQELRRELVTVDCGALVPELSGSEFFGHERGAFTGAHTLREGAFAQADGATLFLDEIGDVPLSMQAQLLRAIQEKSYKRVGGNTWYTTRFRLV